MKPVGKRQNENQEPVAVAGAPRPSVARANGADAALGDDLSKGHEVAALAYQLFMQRGGQHGHDVEDWLAAERRLAHKEA